MLVSKRQLSASPCGNDCTFVIVGNAGMKIYKDKADRDEQFEGQTLWHSRNLAPQCWFKFEFEGPYGHTMFAFYSEVADVSDCSDVRMDAGDRLGDLLEKEYNVMWSDGHGGNVGRIGDKWVIIDFGYMEKIA